MHSGAGEMAQGIKHWVCKCEDWRSDPQILHKFWGRGAWQLPASPVLEYRNDDHWSKLD